eukprot:GDKI01021863.1.p1 GENE.GDKI01021863.1~~GDKI01021863.1.p1  ORF type:complete len:360 (+),score=135.21 GDKI01021863.1:186-1265(+)
MAAKGNVPSLEDIKRLPKVDLHTHFHGDIRQSTLKRLLEERRPHDPRLREVTFEPFAVGDDHKALERCFAYFDLVYLLVEDRDTIALMAREVLSDFAEDNVKYLELRTTPRAVERTGLTKEMYADTFIEAVRWANRELDITVRVIWCVNRTRMTCLKNAEDDVAEVLALAERYPDVTVGLDVAGNPVKGDLSYVLPLLHRAVLAEDATHRHLGLKLTVHTSEADNTEAETDAILAIKPHRLGHCCFLTPAQETLAMAIGACVECCPTSNFHSRKLASLDLHHFKTYWSNGHPHLAICTDDTGLFSTCLSEELAKLANAFSLSLDDLNKLQRAALHNSFADDKLKAELAAKHFRDNEASC